MTLTARAAARPHRILQLAPGVKADASARAPAGLDRPPPLRVVIEDKGTGARYANCLFSTAELAERAPPGTPMRDSFEAGEPIWGRCYLPARAGANRPGELVDVISVDGNRAWEQAYDQALPAEAQARLVPYGIVLRTLLAALPAGAHRVAVDGTLKRGKRVTRLYHGEFRYVR